MQAVRAYQGWLHVGEVAVVAEEDPLVQMAQKCRIEVDTLAFGLLATSPPIQHTLAVHRQIGRHIACVMLPITV